MGIRRQVASTGLRDEAPYSAAFGVHEKEQPVGDRRSLPLPGPAVVRIDAYLARRADLADAKGRAGRPDPGPDANVLFATATGRWLFAADVWRVMRRLAARAGLPDDLTGRVGPEAMRHSFATLYLDAGGSLSDLQEVMGHADPRTTRRYDRERQLAASPRAT